jgi:Mn-dependent DtxR family transcriptional regulator
VPRATSEDAAAGIAPRTSTLRGRVYEFIKRMGRVTDEQISVELGLNPSTARPRRIELAKAGLIRDSGAVAITKSGRRAVLWEAAA